MSLIIKLKLFFELEIKQKGVGVYI